MRLHRLVTALLSVVALAACEKNAVRDLTGPLPTARIKFFNFGLNSPAVHFYAGDRKISASLTGLCSAAKNPPVTANDSLCLTLGRESTAGIAYGDAASSGLYSGIDPGQYTFAARLASNQSTVVSSIPTTIENGKAYSYYQSGLYNATTKTADGFIIEDNFPSTIDWSVSLVRFVNAISNAQPLTLSVINTETAQEVAIGTGTAYKTGSAFVSLPPGTYDLRVRSAGSTTSQILRTNVSFEPGRVYTIAARGDMTVTSPTATNRPLLEFSRNR